MILCSSRFTVHSLRLEKFSALVPISTKKFFDKIGIILI